MLRLAILSARHHACYISLWRTCLLCGEASAWTLMGSSIVFLDWMVFSLVMEALA